jgi:mannose-1-phosphate guanylyltransferase
MATFRTDAPRTCGIVEHDARDVVIAFHEKVPDPPGDLANAAAYVMEPEVVALCRRRGRKGLDLSTEIIPDLIGRIQIYRHAGYHRDIGSIESLRRGRADFGDPTPVPGP